MRKRLILIALLAVIPNALSPTISAQATDASYLSLVRRLVSDSLRSAGARQGEQFWASDSATRALLKASGVIGASMEPPPPVVHCPDIRLTGAEASPVGYQVVLKDTPGADSAQRRVYIGVSCSYPRAAPSRGPFAFSQSCTWDLLRKSEGWMTAGKPYCRIT